MIVSHKHKFIFLKTKKTGGTSLEIVLSMYAGRKDVITLLDREDELIRRTWGGRTPQRYLLSAADLRPSQWWACIRGLANRVRTGRYDRCYMPLEPFRQHMDASTVRRKVGEKIWNSYLKFAVERHPWSRAVSTYYWRTSRWAHQPSFRDFVLNGDALMLPRNYDVYSIQGIPVADRIIDYASLSRELPSLFAELGLPEEASHHMSKLNAKGQYRPSGDYKDYYDEETKRIVGLQCAQEIRLMGYRF